VINTIADLRISVQLILIPVFYSLNQFMTGELILHTLFVVPIAGWHAGFQYYLFAAIPFTLFNNKLAGYVVVIISIARCMLFMALSLYTHDLPPSVLLSNEMMSNLNNANIIISFTALCFIRYYFRSASSQLEKELEKQACTDPLTGLGNRSPRDRGENPVGYHRATFSCGRRGAVGNADLRNMPAST
jgi:hypothetical protein